MGRPRMKQYGFRLLQLPEMFARQMMEESNPGAGLLCDSARHVLMM